MRNITISELSKLENMGDFIAQATKSPVTTIAALFLLIALTAGLSYLASYVTSPLNKFPGPSLACKLKTISPPTDLCR